MARRSNKQDDGANPGGRTSALAIRPPPFPNVRWDGPDAGEADHQQATGEWHRRFEALNLVWVQLRGNWRWLAVIAAEAGVSTDAVSHALVEIGSRLSSRPIDFIVGAHMDLDRASWLIAHLGSDADGASALSGQPFASGSWIRPTTRTIVALESPAGNPLALPVALAADGVVLCVRRGSTPLAAIRKTVEIVGAERVLCCIVLD